MKGPFLCRLTPGEAMKGGEGEAQKSKGTKSKGGKVPSLRRVTAVRGVSLPSPHADEVLQVPVEL